MTGDRTAGDSGPGANACLGTGGGSSHRWEGLGEGQGKRQAKAVCAERQAFCRGAGLAAQPPHWAADRVQAATTAQEGASGIGPKWQQGNGRGQAGAKTKALMAHKGPRWCQETHSSGCCLSHSQQCLSNSLELPPAAFQNKVNPRERLWLLG